MSSVRQSYQKPWLSVDEQLEKLRNRGLIIKDESAAHIALRSHGYYRLSGYWHVFRQHSSGKVSDQFQKGTTFDKVLTLAEFDKSLRSIFLDMLESIEIGFRTRIAHIVGKVGPFAHLDQSTYNKNWDRNRSLGVHTKNFEWMEGQIARYEARSQDEFIKHFNQKYEPPMPIWMTVEVWDFGFLSRHYEGLKYNLKREISQSFSLSDPEVLANWMHSLSLVRNICAHHSRLWNRPLVRQVARPRPGDSALFDALDQSDYVKSASRIYGAAAAGHHLLKQLQMNEAWTLKFTDCVQKFPVGHNMSPENSMGFPVHWQKHKEWSQ